MTAAAYFVLLERRMAAWTQDRIGPNRVGIPLTNIRLWGLGQPLADGLKFIFKEEYTPAHVDKRLYTLAPLVIVATALAIYAVIPFGSLIPPFHAGPIESDKPVELVVAYSPRGVKRHPRVLSPIVCDTLGQAFIAENGPGAGEMVVLRGRQAASRRLHRGA